MSSVFRRSASPIRAARAKGAWVYDTDGRGYLDAASGALVSAVGHGDPSIVAALAGAAGNLDYVHPSVFTTAAVEEYSARVAKLVPMSGAMVFPTSGGAESVEAAVKLARSYHLARGEDRRIVISRRQSYHGNTLGSLRLSGRPPLRGPYEPWLVGTSFVPEVNEYRCPNPDHPTACARWHGNQLEDVIRAAGPGNVAAFIGESIGGATLAAAVPPDGYWEEIARVCYDNGILLIVDEVMTGFARTGSWFAIQEWDVEPDILVSGKGAGAGYWPLGLCVASGEVHDQVMAAGGFVHGSTFSHSPIGAAVGMAVLDRIESDDLIEAARSMGARLRGMLEHALSQVPFIGEIRGRGMLIGVELVADQETKAPFPRERQFVEDLTERAAERGLLVYPSVGCADGTLGDSILIGPPLTIDDEELVAISDRLQSALEKISG
ncbi:MAG: aminotransferase class III-fold pyridoxal phosphate-dependent enzyme [Acidimicrobiia bacterium]